MKILTILLPIISLSIALYLCHKTARRKWIWGILSVLFPFLTLLILVQLGHAEATTKRPSIIAWVGRVLIIIFFCIGLVFLGDSPLVNNETAYAIKAKLVGLISPDVTSVDGITLHTHSGPVEIASFFNSAFSLAAFGAIFGVFAFKRPTLIILSLTIIGFVIGLLIHLAQTSYLISMIHNQTVDVHKLFTTGFEMGLYLLLLITLPVYWLISKQHNPNKSTHSITGSAGSE